MSSAQRLRDLSRWPMVVAPMAGGPSTAALVIAAAEAGGLGYLAGGYKSAAALEADIDAVQAGTDGPFGVNVFVPGRPTDEPAALGSYVRSLAQSSADAGVPLGPAEWDDDAYDDKLRLLMARRPPIVSFTFGCPDADVVRTLQAGGSLVAVTVTTPAEAAAAAAVEPDCLCLQGSEAGAHRGSFANDDRPDQDHPLRSLLAGVRERTGLALIAAGAISTPDDVVAALSAGATQVQLGTAFLRSTESGAHPVFQAALADPRFTSTAVTRAFSGRRARALVNAFVRAHGDAPPAYPEINNATRPLRAAAAAREDPDAMSLYAGEGFRLAQARAAGELLEYLVSGLPA